MRKALIPMLASLALCGAGTAALIATTANAETSPRKPVMTLVGSSVLLAQNMPAPDPGMRNPGEPNMNRDARVKARCEDRFARETGRIAYTETRLNLTQAQRPLFARWKDVQLGIAKRHADECGQMAMRANDRQRPSPADRMTREETRLKQRVSDLEAEQPALAALYNSLSPDQRQSLSPRRGGFGGGAEQGQQPGPRGRAPGNRPPPSPPPQ